VEREEVDGWFRPEEMKLLADATLAAIRSTVSGALVEIGVYKGRSAQVIDSVRLAMNQHESFRELYLIDNFEMETADVTQWPKSPGTTHIFSKVDRWQNGHIALLHQDADHGYDQVLSDLEEAGPSVVVGGMIALHDYEDPTYPGVKRAWEVYSENSDYSPWGRAGHLAIFQRIK
jgi:cephalosporin hydroxylase